MIRRRIATAAVCLIAVVMAGCSGTSATTSSEPTARSTSSSPSASVSMSVSPSRSANPAVAETTTAPSRRRLAKPTVHRTPAVYFANCTAVRDAGAAPLYRGVDPGYRPVLDRDRDGIACEVTNSSSSGSPSSDDTSSSGSGADNSTPAGATALCNDGTYSYAAHHQGACSHHGGVAVWYR